MRWNVFVLVLSPTILLGLGCAKGPQLAPVSGQVTLDGEPLENGTVMLQPTSGQPSRAKIQKDGSFQMSTFREGDGATVGFNKIRVTCYESQGNPQTGEASLGKSMIPRKYTLFDQSGLEVKVNANDNPFLKLELTSE